MIRDDRVCELCVHRGLWPSVRHRCVQGSLGASAGNAAAMGWGRPERMARGAAHGTVVAVVALAAAIAALLEGE